MAVGAPYRGQKLNTYFFFKPLGHPRTSRQKSRDIPQKVCFPWASKDISNFLAPIPSHGRPPPERKTSRPKSLGLGSFFLAETLDKHTWQFPIRMHRGRGQNFPIFISCCCLIELGLRQLGLPVTECSVQCLTLRGNLIRQM